MRNKEVKCVKCGEQVTRRQSLAVEFDQRACRTHAATRNDALDFCEKRRLARSTE